MNRDEIIEFLYKKNWKIMEGEYFLTYYRHNVKIVFLPDSCSLVTFHDNLYEIIVSNAKYKDLSIKNDELIGFGII